jgi:hypothetical protein
MHALAPLAGVLMPVTEQQARAIAFLAVAARPTGASRWDEAGVYANIIKVADRSLGSVVIATMQAAEDRNAHSPGVLPTAGPHWRNPESAPPKPLNVWDHDTICTTCSRPEAQCKAVRHADDDHEFVSRAHAAQAAARPAEAVARIVTDLREQKATVPPPRPEPEAGTDGTSRVEPIRAALSKEDA